MGDESQEGGERKKEKELAIVLEANEREQEICWRSACLPATQQQQQQQQPLQQMLQLLVGRTDAHSVG